MEKSKSSTKTVARRVVRHLTRTRAVSGWSLTIACVLAYALYPQTWLLADPVRQAALIVASVALGAIFLPELSSNLWSVTKAEVRDLIPMSKVTALRNSLLEAQCEDNSHDELWARSVIHGAVNPLIHAEPHHVVRTMAYKIVVHPDRQIEWNGSTRSANLFETEIQSCRRLSADVVGSVFWIAIARDAVALRDEFSHPNCLGREVSSAFPDLNDDQWREMMQKLSGARLFVDGRSVEGRNDTAELVGDASERAIRWYFESAELSEATHKAKMVHILFNYPGSAEIRQFPANFSSYYVTGGLQIRFVINCEHEAYEVESDAFIASTLPKPGGAPIVYQSQTGVEITAIVPDDTLVFPGSGVHFWWYPKT